MKPWLTAKTAGLPRWAWVALLTGGVGVGLYIHSRKKSEEETEATGESEELPTAQPQSLAAYEGTETGGGLQALGVAGPTPQATVPVESPFVPEAFPETLGGQGDVIQGLANGVIEQGAASTELAAALAEREPEREIIREKMVGSPPTRRIHHKPHKVVHHKHKKKHKKAKHRKHH